MLGITIVLAKCYPMSTENFDGMKEIKLILYKVIVGTMIHRIEGVFRITIVLAIRIGDH
jgi:hypothetical protein